MQRRDERRKLVLEKRSALEAARANVKLRQLNLFNIRPDTIDYGARINRLRR